MDTLSAFAMGEANRGRELRVFDWDQAARRIAERKPKTVGAGLHADWDWTGGVIWADGQPVPRSETYTYLASTWAKPELEMDGEVEECWRWQNETPGWDSGTYWPESARQIIAEVSA